MWPWPSFIIWLQRRRLVTISVECAFNYRAPYAMYCFCSYAMYCFCWLSGLIWVAWACIAAYGKRALIRIHDQPPLVCDCQVQNPANFSWSRTPSRLASTGRSARCIAHLQRGRADSIVKMKSQFVCSPIRIDSFFLPPSLRGMLYCRSILDEFCDRRLTWIG